MGLQVDRHVAWREKLGERELGIEPEFGLSLEMAEGVAQGIDRQEGATIDRRDAVRRTRYSWVELLQREAVPAAALAIAREGASWDDLHAVLRGYGVRLEPAGSGARVVGPERGQRVKASDWGSTCAGSSRGLGHSCRSCARSSRGSGGWVWHRRRCGARRGRVYIASSRRSASRLRRRGVAGACSIWRRPGTCRLGESRRAWRGSRSV